MTRVDVIQSILDTIGGETYLEIGCANGQTLKSIKIKNRISIDPAEISEALAEVLLENNNILHFTNTSDYFFSGASDAVFSDKQIDVAFIDGLHSYKQVVKDVFNVLRYLSPRGVIVLHDCNPTEEVWQKVPMQCRTFTGDVWKVMPFFKTVLYKNIFVLDMDYGLGIIAPRRASDGFSLKEVSVLTYSDLVRHRRAFLNVTHPINFPNFLKSL